MQQSSTTIKTSAGGGRSSDDRHGASLRADSDLYLSHAILGAAVVLVGGTSFIDTSRLPLLFIPLSFILASYAAGHTVIRAVQGPVSLSPMLHLAVRLGVGVASLSYIATLCAFSGIFRAAGLITLAFAAYGLFIFIPYCLRFRPCREGIPAFASGLAVGGCWLVVWLWTTIPPIFFDELSFHLVVPERALATGSTYTTPWNVFTIMPHAADLLLAWGMAFAGEPGAHATLYALWLIIFFAAWGLAETMTLPRDTSWLVVMVSGALASASTFWFLGALTYAETTLTVAVLVSAAVLVSPSLERRSWAVAGLLMGLVAATKLSGVVLVAALLASMAVLRRPVRDILKTAAIAAAFAAPWWIRSFVITGNPVYPMAGGLSGLTPDTAELLRRMKSDMPYGGDIPDIGHLLRLPIELVQYPERFGASPGIGALAIAMVFVMLAVPVVLRMRTTDVATRRLGDAAAVFIIISGAGWLLTAIVTRYFAPAFVLCLVGLAVIALRFKRRLQLTAAVLLLLAAVRGGWQFVDEHSLVFSSGQVALGREKGEDYLVRIMDDYIRAAGFVRETLPTDARILFIGENKPFYFKRETITPSVYDQHPLKRWVEESPSTEALGRRLAQEGVTHVVLNLGEFQRQNDRFGLMTFTGADAESKKRRLEELPRVLKTLFVVKGLYVFEVPKITPLNDKKVDPR